MNSMVVNIPLSTAGLTVTDNAAANNLAETLKLGTESVLIHAPAQVANKEVLDTLLSGGLLNL